MNKRRRICLEIAFRSWSVYYLIDFWNSKEWTHGTSPGGGRADGKAEIVERHAVFADS